MYEQTYIYGYQESKKEREKEIEKNLNIICIHNLNLVTKVLMLYEIL